MGKIVTLSDFSSHRSQATDFRHIIHLLATSSEVTLNDKVVQSPNVIDLALGTAIGGRTIQMENGDVYRFAVDKILVTEDPDMVFDEFPRTDFTFMMFIGGDTGAWLMPAGGTTTHASMYRWAYAKGGIRKDGPPMHAKYYAQEPPTQLGIEVVGSFDQFNVDYNGIILPKQPGVPATICSYWTRKGFNALHKYIGAYARANFEGPHWYEYPKADNHDQLANLAELDFVRKKAA